MYIYIYLLGGALKTTMLHEHKVVYLNTENSQRFRHRPTYLGYGTTAERTGILPSASTHRGMRNALYMPETQRLARTHRQEGLFFSLTLSFRVMYYINHQHLSLLSLSNIISLVSNPTRIHTYMIN